MVLGRPGGMRGGAGGRFEGGQRSADLRFAITDLCFGFDTPALLYETGGGFNRYAHSAGPSAWHVILVGYYSRWTVLLGDDILVRYYSPGM